MSKEQFQKWSVSIGLASLSISVCIAYPHHVHWVGWTLAVVATFLFFGELERHGQTIRQLNDLRKEHEKELSEHQDTLKNLKAAREVIHRLHEALDKQPKED